MSVPGGVKGGLVAATAAIYKQFGLGGFYKGLSGEIGADMLGFMLGFGLYDLANGLFYRARGHKPRSWQKGVVGGFTACCSISVTMPLMLATTRLQAQGLPGYPVLYKNLLDCLIKTARADGVGGLWRGVLPGYAKIFPSIFISYFVYER